MNSAEYAYERADKDVAHYQRLLAGSLSESERHEARLLLLRAVRARWVALQQMELVEA